MPWEDSCNANLDKSRCKLVRSERMLSAPPPPRRAALAALRSHRAALWLPIFPVWSPNPRSPAPPTSKHTLTHVHARKRLLALQSALLRSSLCSASSIRTRSLQTSRAPRLHPLRHTRTHAPQAHRTLAVSALQQRLRLNSTVSICALYCSMQRVRQRVQRRQHEGE